MPRTSYILFNYLGGVYIINFPLFYVIFNNGYNQQHLSGQHDQYWFWHLSEENVWIINFLADADLDKWYIP